MKAKCANCGKEMDQEHSGNWKMYCTDEICKKAFMAEAMSPKKKNKIEPLSKARPYKSVQGFKGIEKIN